MPKNRQWPPEVKARAIEMYQAGEKYKTITAETGVPMATIITWLHEAGIRPNRLKQAGGQVTTDQLLTRLQQAEAKAARLELENELLRAQLDAMSVPSDN